MSDEKIDHAALIAAADTVSVQFVKDFPDATFRLIAEMRDALEAAQQAPAVDREALARVIHEVDYYGLNVGGKVTGRSYATAYAVIASGILLDAAEVEARGLEKAAEAAFRVTANMHGGFSNWLNRRAQQVREGARNE